MNTNSNNTVANAVVVNNTNNENMVNNNSVVATPNAEETPFRTVKAQIQGEVQDIILARHKYSMEGLKASQKKQLELIDKTKMLGVIFHLATAEVFYEAGIELRDLDNNEIPAGTQNVFVPVETADTFYRFTIDDVLENVEVHTFANVQEFAEVTGTTTLFSRGLTSKEKIGVAALATNDEVCNAIFDLALEGNMPASTAQLYLDVQVKGVTTAMMTTGYKPKDIAGLGRTYQEAKALFERVSTVFGVNEAKKRYAIRSINYIVKSEGVSLEEIFSALETIPANEVAKAKLMGCGEKESCIVTTLILWIKSQEKQRKAVPMAA